VDGVASGQVAARFAVSISYVVKARQRWDRLGAVTPGAQRSHTRPKHAGHEAVIRAQVRLLPDMTLDELRVWILKELGISVSITTVWKTLRRLELTLKKSPLSRPSRPVCKRRSNSRPRSGGMMLLRGGVKPGHERGLPYRGSRGAAEDVCGGGLRGCTAVCVY
jgi:transposase